MLINNIKSLNINGKFVANVKKGTKQEPEVQYDENGRPYRNHVLERWKLEEFYTGIYEYMNMYEIYDESLLKGDNSW